ncbi:MAG TPA: hypothetical protein PKH16_12020 [Aequorivita sp.]|jgi:hypothetical protein|nr:hypothetical protein [Aequorivita sp.]|tara:strand:- start:198149 stop:198586 length:438 start_codon:yes stop_codon:yes gene_type:complete
MIIKKLKLLTLLFIFGFLITSCIGKKPLSKTPVKQNCFYNNEGYTFINFFNSKTEDEFFPNLSSVLSPDFDLIENYYVISKDTIYIRLPNEKDVNISHSTSDTKILIKNATIKVGANKSLKQVFKLNEAFNVIILDSKYVFNNCK